MHSTSSDRAALFTAGIVIWGATAYQYMNTGFSIAMAVFVLYFLWTRYKKEPFPRWRLDRRMLTAFCVLYGALFVATIFHLDHMKNLSGGYFSAFGFIQYTFPLWMILYIGWTRDVRKAISLVFFAILYAICVYGLVKYAMTGEGRLSSFYHFPTRIGMMMDMFIPFTAAFMKYYWERVQIRYAAMVLIFLEVLCLLLAEVRGSLLAVSAASAVVTALWLARNNRKISAHMRRKLLFAVAAAILSAIAYAVLLRWGNSFAMIGGERFLMWESSFHMWIDNPLTGIGLNEWQAAYAEGIYHPAESLEAGQVMPHNVFIYFFATAGTIGGMAYIIYCWLMLSYLSDNTKKWGNNPFSWAMLFMFIAATVHGLVDQTFILKLTGRIFHMLLGVGILFQRTYEKKSRDLAETE